MPAPEAAAEDQVAPQRKPSRLGSIIWDALLLFLSQFLLIVNFTFVFAMRWEIDWRTEEDGWYAFALLPVFCAFYLVVAWYYVRRGNANRICILLACAVLFAWPLFLAYYTENALLVGLLTVPPSSLAAFPILRHKQIGRLVAFALIIVSLATPIAMIELAGRYISAQLVNQAETIPVPESVTFHNREVSPFQSQGFPNARYSYTHESEPTDISQFYNDNLSERGWELGYQYSEGTDHFFYYENNDALLVLGINRDWVTVTTHPFYHVESGET